ncbi:MAG: hypothetical protein F4Y02_07215 [Chloroflexi bacterium]|nr:hypothetical protein [Chloroflexota bacterium]
MASSQRTRTEYPWGTRAPHEELTRCLRRVESAREATLHPGFSRIRRTTSALVGAARELVAVMTHCAQAGFSVRATKEGKAPIEAEAVVERTAAVNEAVGQLAASRPDDFSERYSAFKGSLDALAKLGAEARASGVKGSGRNLDPYSEFAE